MTCHIGENIVVCDGFSGGWRVRLDGWCQWCLEKRRMVQVLIYGGYCGMDIICGTCGSYGSVDDGVQWRKLTEDERDENIARVAATPDPKCWKCHDTGDTGQPGFDEPDAHPCDCSGEAPTVSA